MSSGMRQDVPAAAQDGGAALLAEVRHAAGNLVHRMHYWTTLLDEEPLGQDRDEALAQLRSSIDGLHELVGRTMDLLRPADVRAIALPAADLFQAVALRFGASCDHALAAIDNIAVEACIDPGLLDRALAMLAEVSAARATNASAPHCAAATLTLERDGHASALALAVSLSAPPRDAQASVRADVSLALAAKLLEDIGCALAVEAGELRLRIPLRRARERANAAVA